MKHMLIEGMSSNLGGCETFCYRLFAILKKEYQIDFITVDDEIPYRKEYEAAGGKIHHITPRYKNVVKFKSELNQVFKENHYDIFWSNKTQLSSIDSLVYAKKNGVKKIILESHNSYNQGNIFTGLMHRLHRPCTSRYIDTKVACSKVAAEWFFGKNYKNVTVLPNSVDTDKFRFNQKLRDEVREELKLNDEDFVIGSTARLCKIKNQRFILECLLELPRELHAKVVLVGQGEDEAMLKSFIQEHQLEEQVLMLGFRKDVDRLYQAFDILMMPSLFEGLPFTLVEAQAAGVPCLVADTVSTEAKLTDIIHFIPLEDKTQWLEKIKSYKNYQKTDQSKSIARAGFDFDSLSRAIKKLVA